VNHNKCHFAAQCRLGSETSNPKRVRFPAAPLKLQVKEPEIGEITNQRLTNTVDGKVGHCGEHQAAIPQRRQPIL
jgi:hypothetical protein